MFPGYEAMKRLWRQPWRTFNESRILHPRELANWQQFAWVSQEDDNRDRNVDGGRLKGRRHKIQASARPIERTDPMEPVCLVTLKEEKMLEKKHCRKLAFDH